MDHFFYDHLRSVFLNFTNLLIFDNIVRWHHMKSMLQIRFPLSISSFLPLLSISFWLVKIDGTWCWKNWIDGTRQRRDLNHQPPDLINDKLDHRTMVPNGVGCKTSFKDCLQRKKFPLWRSKHKFTNKLTNINIVKRVEKIFIL